MWGSHLVGNLPAHAWNIDQLGLDENWKQNVHAAERTKGGGMLKQAWFEFVQGQLQRTEVQGRPGPESVVVSYQGCVSVVVVNRCSEHLSKPRPAQTLFLGHFGNKLV